MSILSDKYKVPEPVIKNMIQDGVISTKWIGRDEVFKLHGQGKSVQEISDATHMSIRHIYRILKD